MGSFLMRRKVPVSWLDKKSGVVRGKNRGIALHDFRNGAVARKFIV